MKPLLITLIIFICSFTSFGQNIEAITNDGKKVILRPDKTWDFVIEKPVSPIPIKPKSTEEINCWDYIQTNSDRMTGKVTISGKKPVLASDDGGKTGIGVFSIISGESIAFSTLSSSTCIDKGSQIAILFTDGSRLSLENQMTFNCDGTTVVFMGGGMGNDKALDSLTTKKIKAIRVYNSKSYIERDFTDEQALLIRQQLDCLKKSINK